MTKENVISLMKSSSGPAEWKANTLKVKEAFGGDYPSFWYAEIISSGICDQVLGKGSSELKILTGEEAIAFFKNRLL